LLAIADEVIPEFKLHMLNAHGDGIPDREGVTYETAFVGPKMRNHPRLEYIPSRLSLLPVLIRNFYRPDVVFIHTSQQRFDTVSLGTEVNILPRAIETARGKIFTSVPRLTACYRNSTRAWGISYRPI
jgi:hypothetical protein